MIKKLVTALTETETNRLETMTTATVRQVTTTEEEPKMTILDDKTVADDKS